MGEQKIYGIMLITLGIMLITYAPEESTASALIIPVGLYLLFSKYYWLSD